MYFKKHSTEKKAGLNELDSPYQLDRLSDEILLRILAFVSYFSAVTAPNTSNSETTEHHLSESKNNGTDSDTESPLIIVEMQPTADNAKANKINQKQILSNVNTFFKLSFVNKHFFRLIYDKSFWRMHMRKFACHYFVGLSAFFRSSEENTLLTDRRNEMLEKINKDTKKIDPLNHLDEEDGADKPRLEVTQLMEHLATLTYNIGRILRRDTNKEDEEGLQTDTKHQMDIEKLRDAFDLLSNQSKANLLDHLSFKKTTSNPKILLSTANTRTFSLKRLTGIPWYIFFLLVRYVLFFIFGKSYSSSNQNTLFFEKIAAITSNTTFSEVRAHIANGTNCREDFPGCFETLDNFKNSTCKFTPLNLNYKNEEIIMSMLQAFIFMALDASGRLLSYISKKEIYVIFFWLIALSIGPLLTLYVNNTMYSSIALFACNLFNPALPDSAAEPFLKAGILTSWFPRLNNLTTMEFFLIFLLIFICNPSAISASKDMLKLIKSLDSFKEDNVESAESHSKSELKNKETMPPHAGSSTLSKIKKNLETALIKFSPTFWGSFFEQNGKNQTNFKHNTSSRNQRTDDNLFTNYGTIN